MKTPKIISGRARRIICILLSAAIVSSLFAASSVTVFAAPYQHYYAAALRGFMDSANGKVKAVLFDLDGDGVAETIALDEGTPDQGDLDHWEVAAVGGSIAIFGVKNNFGLSSYIEPIEYGLKMYQLIITNKRYLVMIDIYEGLYYEIFKYEDGILDVKANISICDDSDGTIYNVNGKECDIETLKNALSEYGINNTENNGFGPDDAAVVVGYGEIIYKNRGYSPAPTDDVGLILAMTSDVEITPPQGDPLNPQTTPAPEEPKTDAPPFSGIEPVITPEPKENADPTTAPGSQTAAPGPFSASPTEFPVYINGQLVQFDAYLINDNNYFKLRDLAYVLSGTQKQFEVMFSSTNNAILLTSGIAYTAIGGEMAGKGTGVKTPVPTRQVIFLNGIEVQFTAFNIDGYNYFKLRDIGGTFNFGVDWDDVLRTVSIDTSKIYVE